MFFNAAFPFQKTPSVRVNRNHNAAPQQQNVKLRTPLFGFHLVVQCVIAVSSRQAELVFDLARSLY